MGIRWAVYNPKTGEKLRELPSLMLSSSLSGYIGQGEEAQVKLPITDNLPSNWKALTEPYRTLIGCYYEDTNYVLWAGIVKRRAWGSGPTIDMVLEPVDKWLDRQYIVGTFKNTLETSITQQLIWTPMSKVINTQLTSSGGKLRDRTFGVNDDMTALRALQNFMGVIDGCEFAIMWQLVSGRLVCTPHNVPRVGSALNSRSFTIRNAEWTKSQDYSAGVGANKVQANGSLEGTTRTTARAEDADLLRAGYLPAEFRWQPDTGSVKKEILQNYANGRLADMRLGDLQLDVKVHVDDIVIGRDVHLGDDVRLILSNPDLPGVDESIIQRMIGWTVEADPLSGEITYLTPILQGVSDGPIVFDGDLNE